MFSSKKVTLSQYSAQRPSPYEWVAGATLAVEQGHLPHRQPHHCLTVPADGQGT